MNRKEFADNELSVNGGNNTSSSSASTSPRFWEKNYQQQTSTLEVSCNTTSSNLSDSGDSKTTKSKGRKKVPVVEYFNKNSTMPEFICMKESDVKFDETVKRVDDGEKEETIDDQEKTLCEEKESNGNKGVENEVVIIVL
jgi:hypothetical protein